MGLGTGLVSHDKSTYLAGAKMGANAMSNAFLADFDQRVAHCGLPASTIQRVRRWASENKIGTINRYKFGSNDIIVSVKCNEEITAVTMMERQDVWIAMCAEDSTYAVSGLKEVAEVYCGPYNLLMRTDDEGKWTGIRLPGQDVPTGCLGKIFQPVEGWGCGTFNQCAGFSSWRSEAQMREAAGTDASFQNRATRAAVGFGIMGPFSSIGAFFSPELHLGALKIANGPQALACPDPAVYAAFRAKTGQQTLIVCAKDTLFDFSMVIGEHDVKKHCEDVLLAVRLDSKMFIG